MKMLIQGFGARDLVAGDGPMAVPADQCGLWNRVAGRGMDLAALAAAARISPDNRAVANSLAFVIGATLVDTIVARGLDRTTGEPLPVRT